MRNYGTLRLLITSRAERAHDFLSCIANLCVRFILGQSSGAILQFYGFMGCNDQSEVLLGEKPGRQRKTWVKFSPGETFYVGKNGKQ